jgi:HK97 family phage prohead protease/HK97 family phage major capsid protein
MPYPNEHSCRLNNPDKYDSFARKNCEQKHEDKCIDVIYGIKNEKSEIESLRFDKNIWTPEAAYTVCKDRGGAFEAASSSKEDEKPFFKFTEPIQLKSIDDDNWIIEGYASTDDIDSYGDKILPGAFEKTLPLYLKNPVLMLNHSLHQSQFGGGTSPQDKLPIGKILDAQIKTRGLWIRAQISRTVPKIWTLIKEGILKGLSIGFNWWTNEEEDTEMDGDVRIIKNVRLIEISVVPVGANPGSLFEMAKAKGINLEQFYEEGKYDNRVVLNINWETDYGEEKELKKLQKEKEIQMEIDVELKQDLENGLKFINQIKEKVQEIPTKAELKEFEDRVKGDLQKVMDEQTKKRNKIEFEAELSADPYMDSSPQVWMARNPQQKFANLIATTTKNQKVKEMQMAADDLLLTHILMKRFAPGYGGIKSLRMFERYSKMSADFRKALDTATAGEGLEWIPTGFSAELIDKVRLEAKVAGLFQEFTMPTNPFKYPALTGDVTVYYMPESLADISEKIPASNIITAGLTFTAKKLAARILFSEESNEDSIVAILPILKTDMVRGLATAKDDVILNGDTTASHQDEGQSDADPKAVRNAKDRRKAFKGLRALCAAGAKYDITTGTTGFTASDLRAVRAQMGIYAVNPVDCAIVTGISAYLQMLSFTEVATVDKFGAEATWLKGYLTALDGMPIVVSEKIRQDLNATGVYDYTTQLYTIALIVNKNAYLIGNRRLISIKTASDIETDQEILVVTQRLDFQPKYTAASEYAVGLAYKITS